MAERAIEFAARGEARLVELEAPPAPEPDQILLRTLYSGITNGTERHALMFEHGFGGGHYPSRHGYQHVGEVVSVGAAVTRFAVGDHAYYGDYVGHRSWNVAGEGGLVVELPADLDHRHCALFGVAGVALRSVRRMGVRQGHNVWVVGQGPIGQFTAQAARAAGARVTVTDLLDRRLEVSRQCGAHAAYNAGAADVPERLQASGPYDFIYDCCSAPELLSQVCQHRLLARGGTVGLTAVRDTVTYPWSLLHGTEARIETSCHFDADDLRVLLFLHQQGTVRIEPVVSDIVPIGEAPAMYERLAHRGDELLGVVFDWTETAETHGDR
jgi:2-desacetyl-2-hydroxyethyl bacteriochlorophyllide A dehydrogenase